MINLLPQQNKNEFTAGRVNVILLRYIWITATLLGLLAVICILTYFMLNTTSQAAKQEIEENNKIAAEYSETLKRAQDFQKNLTVAQQILDRQTNYSKTLLQISALITPGSVLNSILLDNSTYGAPYDLQVLAESETAAIRLKKSFESSDIFTNVQFKTLRRDTNTTDEGNSRYPITVSMQVAIKKEAANE